MDMQERVARVAGEVRAMGFMLEVLIATQPEPSALLKSFDQALPEWTDQLSIHPSTATAPDFHRSVQERLSRYRALLACACDGETPHPMQES